MVIAIALVSQCLDRPLGFGISTYSYQLFQELKKRNIEVKTIIAPLTFPSKPYFLSFKVLLNVTHTKLYHFLEPTTGIIFPLFKKFHPDKVIITTIYDLQLYLFYHNQKNKSQNLYGRGWRAAIRNVTTQFHIQSIRTAVQNSDLLIAISSQTKRDLIDYLDIAENKIRVVPLGADERFKPIKRTKNRSFAVGYLGNFESHKDVPFLIHAYSIFEKQYPQSKLVLYGKGAKQEECLELARKLGIKNAEFRGYADEKDLVNIYNSFDVFVFPSDMEGFGLPIIEAQRCLVPVIVKEKTHIPEEVTKFCLKAKDEQHAAELIEGVYNNGFTFTKEHKNHLAQFTWKNCADRTIEVYEEFL